MFYIQMFLNLENLFRITSLKVTAWKPVTTAGSAILVKPSGVHTSSLGLLQTAGRFLCFLWTVCIAVRSLLSVWH